MVFAIAYTSTAVRRPSRRELEALLLDARDFNARVGVTGALLLSDITFFQYFEGPPAATHQVYQRIQSSGLHFGIVELLRGPIDGRHFDCWHMGFAAAPPGVLLSLSHAVWDRYARTDSGRDDRPLAIELLLHFWHRARRDPSTP
jgi:hypothetical protein